MRVDASFVELYERERSRVFRAAYALCGSRAVAEDATQEAFARALERWGRLRDSAKVAGWVVTTALNVARRDLRRRERPGHELSVAPEGEEGIDLWRAVRDLPERQRQAVVLRYAADLPISEIATAMGCREGTVKAHLAHAREALRTRMERISDG